MNQYTLSLSIINEDAEGDRHRRYGRRHQDRHCSESVEENEDYATVFKQAEITRLEEQLSCIISVSSSASTPTTDFTRSMSGSFEEGASFAEESVDDSVPFQQPNDFHEHDTHSHSDDEPITVQNIVDTINRQERESMRATGQLMDDPKKGLSGSSSLLTSPAPEGFETYGRGFSHDHLLGDLQLKNANDLAVARLVIEEEEGEEEDYKNSTPFQQAEAMDPTSSKDNERPSKWHAVGKLAALVFAVVVVVLVVVLLTVPSMKVDDDTLAMNHVGSFVPAATLAPTTYRESLGIQEQIALVVGSSHLLDDTTPHYKALQWLLNQDVMQLPKSAPNLIQRYALALFYFQTTVRGPWGSCNPARLANETNECDYQELKWVYPELAYAPVRKIRWLSSAHECEWAGVICEGEVVVDIKLLANELSGTLPVELALLERLVAFDFAWNDLTGTLPADLAVQLEHRAVQIQLQSCRFEGTIPKEWFQFKNMVRLNLGWNQLTGTLPTEIGILGSGHDGMQDSTLGLFLHQNYGLSGTIPSEVGNLNTVAYLRLSKTALEGPVPTEIGTLSNLQELWVQKSSISGNIPSEFGRLSELRHLRMQESAITGTIPEEIFSLPHLEVLDLYDTNLGGTISSKIGQLAGTLISMSLYNNSFSGNVPSELGLLTNLVTLEIQQNKLEGRIPQGLCDVLLGRYGSNTTGGEHKVAADCMLPTDTDVAFVACEPGCCTLCCDSSSQTCTDLTV